MPATGDNIRAPVNHTVSSSTPPRNMRIRLPLPSIRRLTITGRVPVATHDNSWDNRPSIIYVNDNVQPNTPVDDPPGVERTRRLRRRSREWDDPILPAPNPEEADDELEDSDDDNDRLSLAPTALHRQSGWNSNVGNQGPDRLDVADSPPPVRLQRSYQPSLQTHLLTNVRFRTFEILDW